MKPKTCFTLRHFLAAAIAALAFGVGCETKSADTPILITPDSVTIRKGQTLTFTAANGYEYTWWLNDESLGTLSTRRGAQVRYTSRFTPPTNTVTTQILHVKSVFPGRRGPTVTNGAPSVGEAYIRHL